MKIYVDELPKSCGDCVFCKQTEYCYYCDKLHTKLGYIDKDKDCPLQPLADYTKQVRKEVIDIIDKKFNCCGYVEEKFEDIKEYILDQIEQGESKCLN